MIRSCMGLTLVAATLTLMVPGLSLGQRRPELPPVTVQPFVGSWEGGHGAREWQLTFHGNQTGSVVISDSDRVVAEKNFTFSVQPAERNGYFVLTLRAAGEVSTYRGVLFSEFSFSLFGLPGGEGGNGQVIFLRESAGSR